MDFCGIICEYNPLHSGHIYHIRKTAEDLNCKGIICVMSGNFVQRGLPAALDKYTRAKWAVKAGADIVIELPAVFAVSPAPDFAYGGVKLLSSLSCVKYISFGSESGDIRHLENFSATTENADIKQALKQGKSYASCFADGESFQSNNILASEYLKALKKLGGNIKPYTVKRIGGQYNETEPVSAYTSATAIRKMLGENNTAFQNFVPDYVYDDLQGYTDTSEKLYNMLVYKILSEGEKLSEYAYISEGLHKRIYAAANNASDFNSLLNGIYTKRYPYSKINRILINILLGITADFANGAKKAPLYAKVLAVKKGGEHIISRLSEDIKVIARADDYKDYSNPLLEKDILASQIYSKLTGRNISDISAGLKKY